MQKFNKWWLPDGETHLIEWMKKVGYEVDGRLTYQYGKYQMAMPFVNDFAMAIDIGAHVGLWSYWMARDFTAIRAFEPMPDHIECWRLNMEERKNAILHTVALGQANGCVSLATRTSGSSGDTGIEDEGPVKAEMIPLDDMAYKRVGFIKIDCEGYEHNVLLGAEKTLLESKPCVLVEQKGEMSQKYGIPQLEACRYLQSLGAELKLEVSGDYIYAWA